MIEPLQFYSPEDVGMFTDSKLGVVYRNLRQATSLGLIPKSKARWPLEKPDAVLLIERIKKRVRFSRDITEWGIYALADPDTGEVRYVGQTTRGFAIRLKGHLHKSKRSPETPNSFWIKQLSENDKSPVLIILSHNPPDIKNLNDLEKMWIDRKCAEGCDLLNVTGNRGKR